MQERTLEKLIVKNTDYIFPGNLTINGDINIENGNLIVSGTLNFTNNTATISIIGGNISAETLKSSANIFIRDGDIWVKYLDLDNIYPNLLSNIDSDSDIEVKVDSYVGNITCLNYSVYGHNCSNNITAVQDVYILGTNISEHIKARDVLIESSCDFTDCGIECKSFVCKGEIQNCSYMAIG